MRETANEPFLTQGQAGGRGKLSDNLNGKLTLLGSVALGMLLGSSSVFLAMSQHSTASNAHAKVPAMLGAETLELIYFNLPCRGELTRMTLHAGGVPFKDTRIELQDWPGVLADPSSMPVQMFGKLPILTKGSFKLAESAVTAAYAAELGMRLQHVPTEEERYLDMMVLTAREDIMEATVGIWESTIPLMGGTSTAKSAPFPAAAASSLEALDRFLTWNPGPFLYNSETSGPSVGDLAIYDIVTNPFPNLSAFFGLDVSKYPAVRALKNAVESSNVYPGLTAYLKSRRWGDLQELLLSQQNNGNLKLAP